MDQLFDLVEFRFDHKRGLFVKHQTHCTNVPKNMAYGKKRTLEFSTGKNRSVRFKVVENGALQYSNTFKTITT
jgi:hypothetical protein